MGYVLHFPTIPVPLRVEVRTPVADHKCLIGRVLCLWGPIARSWGKCSRVLKCCRLESCGLGELVSWTAKLWRWDILQIWGKCCRCCCRWKSRAGSLNGTRKKPQSSYQASSFGYVSHLFMYQRNCCNRLETYVRPFDELSTFSCPLHAFETYFSPFDLLSSGNRQPMLYQTSISRLPNSINEEEWDFCIDRRSDQRIDTQSSYHLRFQACIQKL